MDHLEKIKEYIETLLDEARTSLMFQNALQPFFVTTGDNGFKKTHLTLDDENKDKEAAMMREACRPQSVKAAALLFDCYTYTAEKEKLKEVEGRDLKDIEGSTQSIMTFIYTREGTTGRQIPYVKRGDQDYWFADAGWEVVKNAEGNFGNPFLKSE